MYKGRKPSVPVEKVRKMHSDGKGPAEIAAVLGVSRMSVWRALKDGFSATRTNRVGRWQKMAREKPLDSSIVQAWLAAWNERNVFSDAAVLHL